MPSPIVRASLVALVLAGGWYSLPCQAADEAASPDDIQRDVGLIAAIQTLLVNQGYRPGAANGVLGPQTIAAIRDFQLRTGLQPDSRPSPGLLERLSVGVGDVSPTAGPAMAAESARSGVPLIGTTWEIIDAGGSMFALRFEPGGTLQGPGERRFWKWQLTPRGIRIVYDDKMGTRVVREGRFVDHRWLNGSAASGERHWDWVANRVEAPQSP